MLDTVLSFLNPYRWLAYMAGIAAVGGFLWWGAHTYNVSISKKAVEAALIKERATTAPIIKELASRVAARDAEIGGIKAKSEATRLQLLAETKRKTQELKNALAKTDELNNKLAALRAADADFQRLLDTITANNNSTSGASASARLQQISDAHQQCERGFRAEREGHAKTLGYLSEADAIIKALKN